MYKLYSRIDDRETILEVWGGSTKHPDCVFEFSNFTLSDWVASEAQIVPWILECASKLSIPYHSYELARWAIDLYEMRWSIK
jgi:hypothetical protein